MKLSVKGQFCLLLFTTFSYRLTCIFSCAIEFPVTGFDTFTCPNNLLILQIFSFKTIVTVKPFFISYCKNFYSHVYTSAHTHTHTHTCFAVLAAGALMAPAPPPAADGSRMSINILASQPHTSSPSLPPLLLPSLCPWLFSLLHYSCLLPL